MRRDRIRRTALAVAVLCAVSAIAASAGADPAINTNGGSTDTVNGSVGLSGGTVAGATGPSAPTGATIVSGATGPTAATGTTGATGTAGSGGGTPGGDSATATTGTTSGTGAATPGGGAIGGSAATGATQTGSTGAGGAATQPTQSALPVISASSPQPLSASATQHHGKAAHAKGTAQSGSGSSVSQGPSAPPPNLFAGGNPLADVLPGSWQDPFIVNGAADVPSFYVQSFHIPPFLLPIYQAAGAAYGIPWQTLAAINEVETDYGTNLDVSSAGAIGWMQFLPSTWRRYGVDAAGGGARDPYNAADAIFAAARYLAAAGGTHNLPGAIFAYNHSHAYVRSVLLRAELLSGEPSALIDSVSQLAEGDFPVQLRYHASYLPNPAAAARAAATSGSNGTAPSPGAVGAAASTLQAPAEQIYASPHAAVVAVQDATVVAIGHNRRLGGYVVLRSAFGTRFTYANLGSISAWYPRPKPPAKSARLLSTAAPATLAPGPRPTAPATAGSQTPGGTPPAKEFRRGSAGSAATQVTAVGLVATINLRSRPSAATLFTPLAVLERAARTETVRARRGVLARYFTGAFGLLPSQLELQPLTVGSHVLAGTILGRLGSSRSGRRPHLTFELRPAGSHEPLIDPRPFLDAWSQLETLELHRDSFVAATYGPNLHGGSVGALLLTSQLDLERLVQHDTRVTLPACERAAIAAGNVDRRVLAALQALVLHGLRPSVSGAWCAKHSRSVPAILHTANALALTALDGQPAIGAVASVATKALRALRGASRPLLSPSVMPGQLLISFAPAHQPQALAAAASFTAGFAVSPTRWSQLDDRLARIPEPRVPTATSAAALPVRASHSPVWRASSHRAG